MRVISVGFTPVKGLRHSAYESIELDAHGPVGDRRFCLVDVAKRSVLRTVNHGSLLAVTADWDGSCLVLGLPSGETVSGRPALSGRTVTCDYWGRSVALGLTEGPHADLLSSYVGRDVRLAASPRGGVVYGAPVSLVSTASLRDLGERSGRDDLLDTAGRFRMSVVVDADDRPYCEDAWLGRELRLGDAVVRVEAAVGRCAAINLHPVTGAKDGSLLKTLSGYRPATAGAPWFGVDARVVVPGTVRPEV